MWATKIFCFLLSLHFIKATPIDIPPIEDTPDGIAFREVFDDITPTADGPEYRLPTSVVPTNYVLRLTFPDNVFEVNSFTGTATITIQVREATNQIKFHATSLTIPNNGVQLRTQAGQAVTLLNTNFTSDTVTTIVTVLTSAPLSTSTTYTLTISYTATILTTSASGLYRTSYTDEAGNVRYLAATQLQTTSARRVFPSFDEPSFKATFDVTLIYPSRYNAIFNTDPTSNTTAGGVTTTVYGRTSVMSSYLIAIVLSDFTCSSGEDLDVNVPYRICSKDQAKEDRAVALDLGFKLMRALEDFTQVNYSFSGIGKLDQVAVPNKGGAMENWGLILYGEPYLLWNSVESTSRNKQSLVTINAHEMAHLWFGDLVTCNWWSDAFLNEGFATYFEYFATHAVLPSWDADKQFVLQELQPVLQSDASLTFEPLSYEASTPAELSARFGSVSYNKGGSIFRMVESILGTTAFKSGLNRYLTTHAFSSTKPDDLWNSLNQFATNLPATLPVVMANWTVKAGFPLITIESSGNNVIISQKRFLLSGTDDTEWYVPITYTRSGDSQGFDNTLPRNWLVPGSRLTIQNVLNNNAWFVINNQQTGYYRVDYDDALWDRIATALERPNHDGIHELNRAQIVDDLFYYARNDLKTFSRVLRLTSFLSQDVSYSPWYVALTTFNTILQRTGNARLRTALSEHILSLLHNLAESVPLSNINPDNHIYTLKQILGLTYACRLGHSSCISNATLAYEAYRYSGIRPDVNLRPVIYCNALRYSTKIEPDWEFLWQKYLVATPATEQTAIRTALGCATDIETIHKYLNKSITAGSGITTGNAVAVFSSVYSGNLEGVDVVLDYLIANYQRIFTYLGANNVLSIISGITSRFTTREQADKLSTFIESGSVSTNIQTSTRSYLQSAETNLAWTEAFEKDLTSYFDLEPDSASPLKVSFLTIILLLVSYVFH